MRRPRFCWTRPYGVPSCTVTFRSEAHCGSGTEGPGRANVAGELSLDRRLDSSHTGDLHSSGSTPELRSVRTPQEICYYWATYLWQLLGHAHRPRLDIHCMTCPPSSCRAPRKMQERGSKSSSVAPPAICTTGVRLPRHRQAAPTGAGAR